MISETDRSSATQSLRVIRELVITTARNAADSTTRRISLVRRVNGCSRLPVTLMSRPSTRTGNNVTVPGPCAREAQPTGL